MNTKILKPMLLIIGFSILLWTMPLLAQAQWTTSGTNIYNTNSGNVGIGVTSPNYKLIVAGDIFANGGWLRSSGTAGWYSESYGGGWYMSDTGWIRTYNSKSVWSNSGLLGTNGGLTSGYGGVAPPSGGAIIAGDVGIGVTNPRYKLDVMGNTKLNNVFLGEVGHGPGWAGFAHASSANALGYGLVQRNDGLYTLINKKSGGGYIGFRVDNSDKMVITDTGNIGIGITNPTQKLDVQGDARVAGDLIVDGNLAAKYQDVAEWVPVTKSVVPGTLVVLDITMDNQVKPSAKAYDTRVAGVVSKQPGLILGEAADNKAAIATSGRVKVKATTANGVIHRGDLLVTSDLEGTAMRSNPIDLGGTSIHRPGTVVGKALEPLDKGEGEIMVLLTLQ